MMFKRDALTKKWVILSEHHGLVAVVRIKGLRTMQKVGTPGKGRNLFHRVSQGIVDVLLMLTNNF